jgi:hypothetical protein
LIFSASSVRHKMPLHCPTSAPSIHSVCEPFACPPLLASMRASTHAHAPSAETAGGSAMLFAP